MKQGGYDPDPPSPPANLACREFLSSFSAEFANSARSELTRRLTDASSMDVDALIAGKAMSFCLIVPPFGRKAYSPLLRMWLSGPILAMTRRKAPPKERTLMLYDDTTSWGNLSPEEILNMKPDEQLLLMEGKARAANK